ncbi:MAG: DeoR/GlpR family DNA-binding transcription regulator [Treponema sp.]|jgi:DeoR family glycerol-3-phosphate regulon repressor|nr:DeoR/GlpR family DNA-binding transcription regulator [Treponema sp.]
MFAQERRKIIAGTVDAEGYVMVKELSGRFGVTEDCIRKDLAILEREGVLSRLYGGAVKNRINPHETDVAQRLGKNSTLKQNIAARALSLIHGGDTVFLDISTTGAELARLIAGSALEVTVVTNMVNAMLALSVPCAATLVFIGGNFSPGRDGFTGAAAVQAIRCFRFDAAFMGTAGVDLPRNRVETYLADDGLTKQAALEASKKKYLLLEERKFGTEAPYRYAGLDDFSAVVAAERFSPPALEALARYRVAVI